MFDKGILDVPGPGKYEIAKEILNPEKGRSFLKAGRQPNKLRIRPVSIDD